MVFVKNTQTHSRAVAVSVENQEVSGDLEFISFEIHVGCGFQPAPALWFDFCNCIASAFVSLVWWRRASRGDCDIPTRRAHRSP